MYKTILLPKILDTSAVWWPMVERVEVKTLLRSLQGGYLRAAEGSMRTTITKALVVALCQVPLDLAATGAAGLTAHRLKCQGEWKDIGLGHTKLNFLQKHPSIFNQDKIQKKY
jgi:hypothetical protein